MIPVVFGTPIATITSDIAADGSSVVRDIGGGGGAGNYDASGGGIRSTMIAAPPAATATSAMYPVRLYNAAADEQVVCLVEDDENGGNNNSSHRSGGGASTTSTSNMVPAPGEEGAGGNYNADNNDDVATTMTIQTLLSQGYTRGLIEAMVDHSRKYPLRFWIIDNSSSMSQKDGHRFVETSYNTDVGMISCTRWEEMQQTVLYHANLYSLLNCSTIFRLLNDPSGPGGPNNFSTTRDGRKHPQEFTIAHQQPQYEQQEQQQKQKDLAIVHRTITNVYPSGVTPLTHHIHLIRSNLSKMGSSLRQHGTKVSIIIATDGVPTNDHGSSDPYIKKQFVNALERLVVDDALPVSIVVRLCTDEANVVQYWDDLVSSNDSNTSSNKNNRTTTSGGSGSARRTLSRMHSSSRRGSSSRSRSIGNVADVSNSNNNNVSMCMSMEVLGNYMSEAKKIQKYNRWLNYAVPIHRMREMGYYHDSLNLLNRRLLTFDEFLDVSNIILGVIPMNRIVPTTITQTTADFKIDDDDIDDIDDDADDEFETFLFGLQSLLSKEETQWNPMTQRVEPWINVNMIRLCYSGNNKNNNNNKKTSSSPSPSPRCGVSKSRSWFVPPHKFRLKRERDTQKSSGNNIR